MSSVEPAEGADLTEFDETLRRQPHLMMKLAENALSVAENLRGNYFRNTGVFIKNLRTRIKKDQEEETPEPIMKITKVDDRRWEDLRGEVVTFLDGGIGHVELSNQIPILLRVGSYRVKTGERDITQRENFGYYPVIFGDLEGGSKERKDFTDIVRITAELLGGLSALERTPDLNVLMFHGPLVYLVGNYAGHTPFTEKDIDLFLGHYAPQPDLAKAIKEEFLREAQLDIYPAMTDHSDEWVKQRWFEPLAFMAFLYRRLLAAAKKRQPHPIICGVVERGGTLTDFSRRILLDRVFRKLREKGNSDYFNTMFHRTDLNNPKALLDKLGYTDSLLLAMLMRPGERSEEWAMEKYEGLREGKVQRPGSAIVDEVRFRPLASGKFGFPAVTGCYIHISETVEPIRLEVFSELGPEQLNGAAGRAFLYARLLPRYGFPVGLDIADKHAKVPQWMTEAYAKLIRHHLGVSLQSGDIRDADLRRILVQAIYMTHRDWLFRPKI